MKGIALILLGFALGRMLSPGAAVGSPAVGPSLLHPVAAVEQVGGAVSARMADAIEAPISASLSQLP